MTVTQNLYECATSAAKAIASGDHDTFEKNMAHVLILSKELADFEQREIEEKNEIAIRSLKTFNQMAKEAAVEMQEKISNGVCIV